MKIFIIPIFILSLIISCSSQESLDVKSANELGFTKVSKLKLEVSKQIKEFVAGGGFLFTMCSGTDSYDIALSAEKVLWT